MTLKTTALAFDGRANRWRNFYWSTIVVADRSALVKVLSED